MLRIKSIKIFILVMMFSIITIFNENNLNAATLNVHNQAELVDAIQDAQEDTTVIFADDFVEDITEQIDINIEHTFNIIIDGKGKKLYSSTMEDYRHIQLYMAENNNVTFKNLTFEGHSVSGSNGEPIYDDASNFGGLGVYGADSTLGTISLENVTFDKIQTSNGAAFAPEFIGNVSIKNTSFNKNVGMNASSIYARSIDNFSMDESEFINNINSSASGSGYFSGNVRLSEIAKKIEISNSFFEKNKIAQSYGVVGGGALSISMSGQENSIVSISDNIFKGNDTDYATDYPNGKGGAISIHEIKNNNITIENSLFDSNIAGNSGSAIHLSLMQSDNSAINDNVIVRNSTFTKNHSKVLYPLSVVQAAGGTIHIENNSGVFKPKIYQNTIINNSAAFNFDENDGEDEQTIINKYGVGISSESYDPSIITNADIKGNIILNNKLVDSNGVEFSSDRLNVNSQNAIESNNIGYDNGTPINSQHNLVNVFGTNQVQLKQNDGSNAGITSNKKSIDSFMILPQAITMGIADNKSIQLVNTDQRLKTRSTVEPDIGAVEIGSIKYDSNGGSWTLSTLSNYDGGLFYEGSNPKQLFYAMTLNSSMAAINKDNLSKKDSTFLGWSTNKNATTAEIKPGDSVVAKEQTVLYAVWKVSKPAEDKLIINFVKNASDAKDGKFTQLEVIKGKSLKEQGLNFPKPTRKGYTLVGWSTSKNSNKANFTLNTKINSNMKVYAVWKKSEDKIPVPKTGNDMTLILIIFLIVGSVYYYRRTLVKE